MQTIFDHLTSLIVAGIVVLSLSVTQTRSSHSGIEQVAAHGVKSKALVFGHWIERDILDIGANMGRNRYRFVPPVDSAGNTVRFTFFSDSTLATNLTLTSGAVLVPGDTLRLHTRYRLRPTRTVQLRGADGDLETHQLYALQREIARSRVVNTQATRQEAWRADRWSISTLSFFNVGLLRRTGEVTTDVERADYVSIRFAVVPEHILNPENFIREMFWSTTLKVRPFWEPPPDA